MSTSNSAVTMVSEETQSLLRYPSDLIDEEWEILQPIIDELEPYTTGCPQMTDLREILNAIFYLNKTGCPWRYLPKDFLPYKLVNYINTGKIEIQTRQQQSLTAKESKKPQNLIWDQGSMTVISLKEEVDTMGFLIIVRMCTASIFDGKAARQLITDMFLFLHTVTKIWADNGYSGPELSDWLWHPIRMPDRGR